MSKKYLDMDGLLYLWSKIKALAGKKVDKSGDTMTGPLTLSGAPTVDLHAATKQYVDDSVAPLGEGDMLKSIYDTHSKNQDVFDYVDARPQGRLVHFTEVSGLTAVQNISGLLSCKDAMAKGFEVFGEIPYTANGDLPDGVATDSVGYVRALPGNRYFVLLCNGVSAPYEWFKVVSSVTEESYLTDVQWTACNAVGLAETGLGNVATDTLKNKVGPATAETDGLMSAEDCAKLSAFGTADRYALKSDITAMYRYRGSKAAFGDLPADGAAVGDVWNVEDTGMNYAWTGETWDALGEIFEIQSISNAEIDAAAV